MDDVLTEQFGGEGRAVRWGRTGSGPAVIMCHGTPWSSFVWRAAARRLASRRTVYLWDMLGYGRSDKPDADVSIAAQGRILAALFDHWGLAKADVVAHDYGGAVALRAHLLDGAPVRSFLLADVVALRPWGSPFFRLVAEHAEVFSQLPANLHRALVTEYVAGAAHRPLTEEVREGLVGPWLGEEGQAAFYRQIAQADERHTDEIEPLYPGITVPTLVVWGTEDTWIPVDRAHRLEELIPGSRLELIRQAGHLLQEDQPERFTALVESWLSEVP